MTTAFWKKFFSGLHSSLAIFHSPFLLLFIIHYPLSIIHCGAQLTGIRTFTISSNGSSPQILSLKKHSKGYLLAGTSDGLYRFDGSRFTAFAMSGEIKDKSITAIAEGKEGMVWVGFRNGEIGHMRDKTVELLKAEEGHPAVAVTCILADTSGTVYFATAGEGIYFYTNQRFYNINMDDGLSDNYVYELYTDNRRPTTDDRRPTTAAVNILACTDRGINHISVQRQGNGYTKHVRAFTSADGLPDNIVKCLYPQTKNTETVYSIGMQDKGIGYYMPSREQNKFSYTGEWTYGQVNSIIATDNQLWAATESNGIVVTSPRPSSREQAPTSIAYHPEFIKADNLLADDEGNIWFTSFNKLVRTNGAHLENVIPIDAKLFAQIHTLLADSRGNFWVNTNEGLVKYSFSTQQLLWQAKAIDLKEITVKTDVTALYEDKFGNIWIGTLGRGVIMMDAVTGKTRNLTEERLLVNGSILSISGLGNDIWISSLGGVVRCTLNEGNTSITKPYSFSEFSEISSIGSNYIYTIMPDSKGRTWFATDGKGVIVYDNGAFTTYNERNGIKSSVIYNICEDKLGNIWFSSLNNGLYKFDGKKFQNVSTAQGLNDATITSLTVDAKGNVVAISGKGFNIIDPHNNSISYLDAGNDAEQLNTDLNCISVTDAIYTVSSKGIVRYVPTATRTKPHIVLNAVQLFLKDIPPGREPKFDYDENNFSFSYTGISFSHPDKIRYQYKLEGLGNQWITTKDDNINFPKLAPGKYTFHVRASINDRFEGSDEVTYSFVIHKPFWWQWWFITLLIVVIVGGIWWYVKEREKRVHFLERTEKEKIRSQFETLKSQVNPHFLFNSFNTLISVIEDNPENAVQYVEHLSDLYRKIVTYRDKDLITIKEECELIDDYFFIQKKRFGDNLQFNCYVSEEDKKKYLIAPLTLQLLAENAVKHNAISSETPLNVELYTEGKSLVVRNNINKKFTAERGAGMGLQNIQKRYELLSNTPIEINKTDRFFIVHIPLITVES